MVKIGSVIDSILSIFFLSFFFVFVNADDTVIVVVDYFVAF